ncbi:Phosphotyrosyl phosphatase activator [Hyphopichia burtonii NRRL Y-1933]|uniref:Serine/threonine-protein phosphatase 2A activator n=1 Tax=Hyphopichia burtonii NRRL Y-1933 TaxID=984485 RepID=A0A1E4RES3_9ASCO|nr:Phosphotyrosyl phosphatase activator [Hyphopichia burtonii NRRL Y-1933]ODV65768.1 Phosphotyrosyl phosphatase activator [Hyphopichia burtonii NRRL Y-1933]
MAEQNQWTEPSKKIFDGSDIARFQRSLAKKKIHHTLAAVIEKVKGCEVPKDVLSLNIVTKEKANIPPPMRKMEPLLNLPPPSQNQEEKAEIEKLNDQPVLDNYQGILKILQTLNTYIDQNPPLKGPRRFGNLACRDWHDNLIENIDNLLISNLKIDSKLRIDGFLSEIKHYILNSFGSQLRLDYGTGHELSFLAFLGGLFELKILDIKKLSGAELLTIFGKYYDLCRRLILLYSLEPAGSHGVWGLDDHFHLIYILGAAQFNGSQNMMIPSVLLVLSDHTISSYKLCNLYVNAIAFIHKIKLGPFNEHSPIIFDIHATVSLWPKVLQGLSKMYEVEVLGKFPVVQHFWFGAVLYPWRDFETDQELPVFQKEEKEKNEEEFGFLNNNQGIKTTRSNLSMTGAPWASLNTSRPTPKAHTSRPVPNTRFNAPRGTSRPGATNRP